VQLLLERGANPRWEEPDAPHGTTLHKAAVRGDFAIVKLLLDHGADPNEDIDSTSSASVFAATPEIRDLIDSRGAELSPYDTSGLEHDDDKLRALAADQRDTHRIGAAITMSAHRPGSAGAPARRRPSHAGLSTRAVRATRETPTRFGPCSRTA
jgi:hypothetical protein